MSEKKKKLGDDPFLGFIKDTTKEKDAIDLALEARAKEKKLSSGRPPSHNTGLSSSSSEGLSEGYARYTFIVREDLLEKFMDYAYQERLLYKTLISDILEEFFKGKKITIKRPNKEGR